jgi:hypothetical protein
MLVVILFSVTILRVIMICYCVEFYFAECSYSEFWYAGCHCAEYNCGR